MPSASESCEQAAEVIARHVERSVLATPIEFIDEVADSLVCLDRAVTCSERVIQRDGVARAGARMFEISRSQISMVTFTGNLDHAGSHLTTPG
jgi:hypothetical protein